MNSQFLQNFRAHPGDVLLVQPVFLRPAPQRCTLETSQRLNPQQLLEIWQEPLSRSQEGGMYWGNQ